MGRLHQFAGTGGRAVRVRRRRSRPVALTLLGQVLVLGTGVAVLAGFAYWLF